MAWLIIGIRIWRAKIVDMAIKNGIKTVMPSLENAVISATVAVAKTKV